MPEAALPRAKRPTILVGMMSGVLWGIALIWIGVTQVPLPIFSLLPVLAFAFLGPGLFLMLLVGRLAQRRFFDDAIIDGQPLVVGSAAEIDQRVLTNTVEQLVLALCLWPATAYLSGNAGPGIVATLGIGFLVARLMFWAGYHLSPPLRGFGFAATFYPTILALGYSILHWAF